MVARVKSYKAGFVTSDSNISPIRPLKRHPGAERKTGHPPLLLPRTELLPATGRYQPAVTTVSAE